MFQREQLLPLLHEHIKSKSLLKHVYSVEGAMVGYANHFNADVKEWGALGLLHDLDFESHPHIHPRQCAIILKDLHYPEDFIEAVMGHSDETGVARASLKAKALYAVDELSGFILAAARVRPTGLEGLEPSSIKKKMKDKAFARAVNREQLKVGAEALGIDFTEHLIIVIEALKAKELSLNKEGFSLLE